MKRHSPLHTRSPLIATAAATLVLLLFAGLIATIIHLSLTAPVVFFSHLTQGCVSVSPPTAGSCTNLPKKYSVIYTQ